MVGDRDPVSYHLVTERPCAGPTMDPAEAGPAHGSRKRTARPARGRGGDKARLEYAARQFARLESSAAKRRPVGKRRRSLAALAIDSARTLSRQELVLPEDVSKGADRSSRSSPSRAVVAFHGQQREVCFFFTDLLYAT